MQDNLILQDKNYISAKQAATIFGYASDYIGQLCRSGKLECKMIGRSWFVTKESLIKHKLANQNLKDDGLLSNQLDHIEVENNQSQILSDISKNILPKEDKFTDTQRDVVQEKVDFTKLPNNFSLPKNDQASFIKDSSLKEINIKKNFNKIESKENLAKKNISNFEYFKSNTIITTCVFSLLVLMGSINSNTNLFTNLTKSGNLTFDNISKKVSSYKDLAFGYLTNLSSSDTANSIESLFDKDTSKGVVVLPSQDSSKNDSLVLQNIKDSFSDEVYVKRDENGESGVITPVFKKAGPDDFLYMLVPVKEKK